MQSRNSRRLYLVDGSGYIFRAYHALPPLTRKRDGMPARRRARALSHPSGTEIMWGARQKKRPAGIPEIEGRRHG